MADYSQQIRQQMNIRARLQQSNNQLRTRIGELNAKRRELNKRLQEIKRLRDKVNTGLAGRTDAVSSSQRELARDIERAITMQGFTDQTVQKITREIEPSLPDDSAGSSMLGTLAAEIRRIENELEETERSINNANSQIEHNNRNIRTVNQNIQTLQRAQAQG